MKNEKPTQCKRVIQYMKDFGSITTLQAFTDLGVVRLGARISELRSAGLPIKSERITVKNRYNEDCSICKYTIEQQGETA